MSSSTQIINEGAKHSELAGAAYVNLEKGDINYIELQKAGMSEAQARTFANTYQVVAQKTTWAGSTATIFEEKEGGRQHLSISGTVPSDPRYILGDTLIGIGTPAGANFQYIAIRDQVGEWLSDGTLKQQFEVDGHSAGAYMGVALKQEAEFSENITHAYAFNGPGEGGIWGDLAQLFGASPGTNPGITYYTTAGGISPIAGLGIPAGAEMVFVETPNNWDHSVWNINQGCRDADANGGSGVIIETYVPPLSNLAINSETPQNGSEEDLFNTEINTSSGTFFPAPADESDSISQDNSTLYRTGTEWIMGFGDVNTATGNVQAANSILSDGLRPGAWDMVSYTEDYFGYDDWTDPMGWAAEEVFGGSFVNSWATDATYWEPIDPLVLDLNGDGVKLTSFGEAPVLFDVDHDGGSKEITGWVSQEDGIVVMDLNNNGTIDGIHETMSEYFNGVVGIDGEEGTKTFANGFAALKSLDANNDNAFTAADAAWNNVKIWQDANHDGVTDPGELKTLTELGITRINLSPVVQSGLVNGGNEVLATGTFIQNGQSKEAQAARFIANSTGNTAVVGQTGIVVSAQDGQSTYVSSVTTGEVIDLAAKGVKNAYGNAGNDTLTGDAGVNWLAGGQGADTFSAGAGDDMLLIDADDRQENIHARAGFDMVQVVGDRGVTLNLAQAEAEVVVGGSGDDVFAGGGRSSVFVRGGDGDDILIGGTANDALSGENGDDLIDGGAGNDVIRGGRGRDQIMGGAGDDVVEGGMDDDRLLGEAGNDILKGKQGDDILDGGNGIDIAEFSGNFADYRITRLDDTTYRIVDTKTGRDGADTLRNIEKLNFARYSAVDITLDNPMPAQDVITIADRTGTKQIKAADLLANDRDWQNDALHITTISDIVGGTIVGSYNATTKEWTPTLTASGELQFTPDPAYTGVMSFKYKIADADGTRGTTLIQLGTTNSAEARGQVFIKTPDMPIDSLFTDEWYLSDINVLPVWKDYTGKGVTIAQFEPGMLFSTGPEVFDYRHPDLQANTDASWLSNPDADIPQSFNQHATLVAGVMVGARDGEGAVGVAYDAKLSGHFFQGDHRYADVGQEVTNALAQFKNYDIVNNSWGMEGDFTFNYYPVGELEQGISEAVRLGRNGRGTVIVVAGGNERGLGGNTNYNYLTANRTSITTGAINAQGDVSTFSSSQAAFSNPGASILVSAPGTNIASTSRILTNDDGTVFGSDTATVQGTSLAAPIVSGVVALMLEANPNLGWRDIQQILALSAKKVNDPNTDTVWNGAINWNGGGMHTSHDYGFGKVDARAAVRLAETWQGAHTSANERHLAKGEGSVSGGTNLNIAINNGATITRTLAIGAGLRVEHATVSLDVTHSNWGDLTVMLISPTGVASKLLANPGSCTQYPGGDMGTGQLVFALDTTHDYGENAQGNWQLRITDRSGRGTGVLNGWKVDVYGSDLNETFNSRDTVVGEAPVISAIADNTYFYTDEFTSAPGTSRATLTDSNGGVDIINAAAVSSNSTINLSTGSTSSIAGRNVTLNGQVEYAFGGDGNDTITGNALSNYLSGGRGNDNLNSEDGLDLLDGGQGNNIFTGGAGSDLFVIRQAVDSVNTITDFSPGTAGEKILLASFDDITDFSQIIITQEGANTRLGLGNGQSVVLQNIVSSQISVQNILIFSDMEALETHVKNVANITINKTAVAVLDTNPGLITGSADADILTGDAGGNTLDGGAGADTMTGRTGDDTYIVDNADDAVNELPDGGFDTVKTNVTYSLSVNVENLVLSSSTAINGTGNAEVNRITGNTADNMLDGGASADTMLGGAGNDTYVVDNQSDMVVEHAGDGTDTVRSFVSYTLSNEIENLTLTGTDDIHATGNNLANNLAGNVGDNILDGAGGADTMAGGAGDDTYLVDSLADVVTENLNEGVDVVYASLNYTLGTNVEHLVLAYGAVSGTGNGQDNWISGNSSSNTLSGGAGDDILDGYAGVDTLIGGAGDDTYILDNVSDKISENVGEGIEMVRSSVSYTLGANIENLVLTGTSAINGTGNTQDNLLTGNSAANALTGGAGNDTLNGGAGADTMRGGLGNDIYLVDNAGDIITENANEGADAIQSSVTYTLGANVENLTLTGISAINGTGNTLNNVLIGNSAANTLNGGTGADALTGGAGNDIYLVDNFGDIVSENADEGTDTIQSSVTSTLGANIENLTLTGTSAISSIGNELNNILTGNSAANTLDGGVGADIMIGGAGNDIYMVDDIGDIITENASAGTDIVQSSITYTLGANVENLTLTGTTDLNGTGNALNNVLTGNSSVNILNGGIGTDTMRGGSGNDIYLVDNTGDIVTENTDEGEDTIQASVTYTLGVNVENLTLTGSLTINGTGNTLSNVLIGNSAANTLNGGAGADTMLGGFGNDIYLVDNTDDIIIENAVEGSDTLQSSVTYTLGTNVENLTLTGTSAINGTGNELNNILTGNSAANILDGGVGVDTLIGGSGNDIYLVDTAGDIVTENTSAGADTVQSGITYTLGANVENLTLTGASALNGTGNTQDNLLTGNSAANILTGGAGNDTLNGGTGTDTMLGGIGNDIYVVDDTGDIVVENASAGTDTVQSSITYTLGANVENLTLTGTTDLNGTGNGLNNILTGNSAANILDGGVGTDTMIGGASNDIYLVDNTGDIVTEYAGEGEDTIQASVTSTLGANVENLTLTGTSALNGTGNTLNNVLIGNSAANTLNGGTGADTMLGGLGNDIYVIDNLADIVTENSDEGTDVIQSSATYTLGANIENLTLTGASVINGTGNEWGNILTGNGAANTLDGGIGVDTMLGGLGNDIYVVDNVGDVVTENASAGTDTVQTSISYTLGANVENLTLTGNTDLNGTGNTLKNVLIGNSAANILNGGAGIDTMLGGLGNDIYLVDNTGDIVTENAGEGEDAIQSSVTSTLGANVENLTLTGTSAINGTGNTLDNVLTGNIGANTLNGGTGNDLLIGGLGNDTLTGGAGNDIFLFDSALNATTNKDTLSDFVSGQDIIKLDKDIFTSLTLEGTLSGAFFNSSATGAAADTNDYFLYNTTSGALLYDADGNGAGAAVQFATLSTKPQITASDFMIAA